MVQRVILIMLEGYDPALGERLADAGAMPALRRLHDRSARFAIDDGESRWSGLAGEHISTGLTPVAANRMSAVSFDRARYSVHQEGTRLIPFPALLPVRTVVFNPTYFEMALAPSVQGIVGWDGAHDPGANAAANPATLPAEIAARFGPDPGRGWSYTLVWPSPERTEAKGRALTAAVAVKSRVARWLLGERLPEWDLAILSIGEVHSGLEAFWHGVDPEHPLAGEPSAKPAGAALRDLYMAVDGLIGDIAAAFPDAALAVVSKHGMGANTSDLAGMALLPELLYRRDCRGVRLVGRPEWDAAPDGLPRLPVDADWHHLLRDALVPPGGGERWRRRLDRLWRGAASPGDDPGPTPPGVMKAPIDWMPAAQYSGDWPFMRAFALPAFYDGRIRLNLAGRESRGRVRPGDYEAECARIVSVLEACRDLRTGAPVVETIERAAPADPRELQPNGADLIVRWRGAPVGFVHPSLGRIGPLPYRRPGGHTGGCGMLYLAADGLVPGDYGSRSAFDVIPSVIDLLGVAPPQRLSGSSLLEAARA